MNMTTGQGMGGYTAEELLQAAREDAYHGMMMGVALPMDHPLRLILKNRFEIILQTIDAHKKGEIPTVAQLGEGSGGSGGDGGSGSLSAGMAPA